MDEPVEMDELRAELRSLAERTSDSGGELWVGSMSDELMAELWPRFARFYQQAEQGWTDEQ